MHFFLVSENFIYPLCCQPRHAQLGADKLMRMMKLVLPGISQLLYHGPAAAGGPVPCHISLDLVVKALSS